MEESLPSTSSSNLTNTPPVEKSLKSYKWYWGNVPKDVVSAAMNVFFKLIFATLRIYIKILIIKFYEIISYLTSSLTSLFK